MTPTDQLVTRLEGVQTRSGGQYLAKCPAHQDRSPSLSIKEADDGRTLVHCFGGCSVHDVLAAVGLEPKDLFPPRENDGKPLPARERFNPRAVLATLEHEARVVLLAASEIAEGKTLSSDDADRIAQAQARISEAMDQAGIRRS